MDLGLSDEIAVITAGSVGIGPALRRRSPSKAFISS